MPTTPRPSALLRLLRRLVRVAVLLLALQISGLGHAVTELVFGGEPPCTEDCEGDTDDGQCPPFCEDCPCAHAARPVLPVAAGASAFAPDAGRAQLLAHLAPPPESPDPSGPFHPPRR